jgi:O-antigen/teichoic acid export membrane protein
VATNTTKDSLIRRRVARGTASNAIGQALTLGTWFLLTPFILSRLGSSSYGLWALVGSVVAYGSLLDLGIAGAIIKYMAEYNARGETSKARSLIATSLWLYTALGLASFALSALIAPIFPLLFNLPPEQRTTTIELVLVMGIVVGISIPCTTTAAVLRGLQRFDLASSINTAGVLLSALATVVVLLMGGGVVAMVAVNIPITLAMQLPAIWLIRRVAPELRFGWRGASRQQVRSIISFSSALFLMQVSSRIQSKTDEIVIAAFLPVSAITPYAIARKLSEAPQLLTEQFLKVLQPLAAELNAENDQGRLRGLYIVGTRLSLAIFIPIGGALLILVGPVLTIWIGPAYAAYGHLVVILTLTGLINTSQWPAGSVLYGMSRQWPLAVMSGCTALANLVLSLALVRGAGLTGVALGTLIPTLIVCLGIVMPYTMRILGVGLRQALREILLPPLLPALPASVFLYVLARVFEPSSLIATALVASAGLAVYAIAYLAASPQLERRLCGSFAQSVLRFAKARLGRSGDTVPAHRGDL